MKKIINVSHEALGLINEITGPSYIEDELLVLDAAEEKLSRLAYDTAYGADDDAHESNNLYTMAFQLRLYAKDLRKLVKLLKDEKEE